MNLNLAAASGRFSGAVLPALLETGQIAAMLTSKLFAHEKTTTGRACGPACREGG